MYPSSYNPQECDFLVVIIPSFQDVLYYYYGAYWSNMTEISDNIIMSPYHALINNIGKMTFPVSLSNEAKHKGKGSVIQLMLIWRA